MVTTFEQIASRTLSTSTTTVTFSDIPATYTDLLLRVNARTDYGGTSAGGRLSFNGNSSTVYNSGYLFAYNGSTLASSAGFTGGTYFNFENVNGTGAMANAFGINELYISEYASNTDKSMSLTGGSLSNSTTASGLYLYNYTFTSSAAISSLSLLANTGNWVANSTFYLYGIKNT